MDSQMKTCTQDSGAWQYNQVTKGKVITISIISTRSSANAEVPCDAPQVRNIALEKACNRGLTFEDTQGYYSCCC